MPILFVHGRAQENKNADSLHAAWRASLIKGAATLHTTASFFPHYGDQLAALVPRAFADDAEHALRSASTLDSSAAAAATEISLEYAEVAAARASASRLVLSPRSDTQVVDPDNLVRGRRPAPDPDAELRGRSLNAFLGVVDKVVPGASRLAVEFLRDVAVYLSNEQIRAAVLAIVKAELDRCQDSAARTGEPVVVVAHSLGSVVAHDLLCCEAETSVALLVTVGSPLGVRTIRDRLLGRQRGAGLWPRAAQAWINASDARDVVALVPAFGRTGFFDEPAKRSARRCDVLNLVDLANDTDNHHGITGYLDHPELANWIEHFLRKTT